MMDCYLTPSDNKQQQKYQSPISSNFYDNRQASPLCLYCGNQPEACDCLTTTTTTTAANQATSCNDDANEFNASMQLIQPQAPSTRSYEQRDEQSRQVESVSSSSSSSSPPTYNTADATISSNDPQHQQVNHTQSTYSNRYGTAGNQQQQQQENPQQRLASTSLYDQSNDWTSLTPLSSVIEEASPPAGCLSSSGRSHSGDPLENHSNHHHNHQDDHSFDCSGQLYESNKTNENSFNPLCDLYPSKLISNPSTNHTASSTGTNETIAKNTTSSPPEATGQPTNNNYTTSESHQILYNDSIGYNDDNYNSSNNNNNNNSEEPSKRQTNSIETTNDPSNDFNNNQRRQQQQQQEQQQHHHQHHHHHHQHELSFTNLTPISSSTLGQHENNQHQLYYQPVHEHYQHYNYNVAGGPQHEHEHEANQQHLIHLSSVGEHYQVNSQSDHQQLGHSAAPVIYSSDQLIMGNEQPAQGGDQLSRHHSPQRKQQNNNHKCYPNNYYDPPTSSSSSSLDHQANTFQDYNYHQQQRTDNHHHHHHHDQHQQRHIHNEESPAVAQNDLLNNRKSHQLSGTDAVNVAQLNTANSFSQQHHNNYLVVNGMAATSHLHHVNQVSTTTTATSADTIGPMCDKLINYNDLNANNNSTSIDCMKQSSNQRTSVLGNKTRRGRPRKKGPHCKNKVSGKLWEFIRDLLLNDRTNPSFIRWERREDGVFKFVQSDKVAKMWGERKQNPKMTYEKLSRAMRYYYKSKVLLPVFGRRLVYKFGPNATGWLPAMDSVEMVGGATTMKQQQQQQHNQLY